MAVPLQRAGRSPSLARSSGRRSGNSAARRRPPGRRRRRGSTSIERRSSEQFWAASALGHDWVSCLRTTELAPARAVHAGGPRPYQRPSSTAIPALNCAGGSTCGLSTGALHASTRPCEHARAKTRTAMKAHRGGRSPLPTATVRSVHATLFVRAAVDIEYDCAG